MALTASSYSKAVADFDGNLAGSIETWVYTETADLSPTQEKIKYVFGFKQTSTYSDNQRFTAWIDGDVEYDDTFLNNKGSDEWQFYAVTKTYNRPAYGAGSVNHTARCRVDDIYDGPTSDTGHQNTDTDVTPKVGTTLPAPGGVVWAGTSSSSLQWNWNDAASAGIGPAATDYWVQVAWDAGFTNLVANGLVGNVNSYTIGGLPRATTFYFRVRAHNAYGAGAFSGPVGATTAATVPDTMAGPIVSAATTSGFTVGFTAPNNGGNAITSYELQYTDDNFFTTTTVPGITSSPRILTGLAPGKKYRVRMRAINAVGGGSWSPSSLEIQTLGGVKVRNDANNAWIEGIVRMRNEANTAWNVVVVRKWNGTSWVV
jgi:hypothetical protein